MAVQVTRSGVALTVGIIILALVALGGLYLVKNQGEQARRDEAIQVAEGRLEADTDQDAAPEESVGDQPAAGEIPGGSTGDDAAENGQEQTTTPGQSGQPGQGQSGQAEADELPQTGPESVGILAVFGAVTYAAVLFIRSRNTSL